MSDPTSPAPSGVSLPQLQTKPQVRPGGFWLRVLATFIDGMILNILSSPLWVIYYAVFFMTIGLNPETVDSSPAAMAPLFLTMAIIYPLMFVIFFFYYGWFYKNKGATLGKMIFKMKVVNFETGENIGYGRTFLREFIGKFVCALTLGIGYLIIAFREDKRGLHDMIATTQVLRQIK